MDKICFFFYSFYKNVTCFKDEEERFGTDFEVELYINNFKERLYETSIQN